MLERRVCRGHKSRSITHQDLEAGNDTWIQGLARPADGGTVPSSVSSRILASISYLDFSYELEIVENWR